MSEEEEQPETRELIEEIVNENQQEEQIEEPPLETAQEEVTPKATSKATAKPKAKVNIIKEPVIEPVIEPVEIPIEPEPVVEVKPQKVDKLKFGSFMTLEWLRRFTDYQQPFSCWLRCSHPTRPILLLDSAAGPPRARVAIVDVHRRCQTSPAASSPLLRHRPSGAASATVPQPPKPSCSRRLKRQRMPSIAFLHIDVE